MPRGSYVAVAACVTVALLILGIAVWIDCPYL